MQQNPILEGTRLHLVGVANEITRKRRILGDGLHFLAGRESGTTAAQQHRIHDQLFDLCVRAMLQAIFGGTVPTAFTVLVDGGDPVRFAVLKKYLGIVFCHIFLFATPHLRLRDSG